MLVFFIVALPMLVGAVGFAIDLVRAQTLQTELQRVADAAALAAAHELNFEGDSLARARAVALAMPNRPRMAASAAGAQILEPQFYASINPDIETSDPQAVRYVRVRTVLRTSSAWFIKIVGGTDASVDAEAWAESRIQACGAAPLFFCVNKGFNPAKGTQVLLKYTGSYGPGNFGLLDPQGVSSGVGAKLITQNLAAQTPSFCYTGTHTVRTGQVAGPVISGIGVRFDMYPTDNSSTSQYLRSLPPAPAVLKGKVSGGSNNSNQACTFSDSTQAARMPRDGCIVNGACWQGNGDWQTGPEGADYFSKNWGALRPPNWPSTTRFETYLWELQITEETQTPNLRAKPADATSPEIAAPACYNFVGSGGPPNNARRRVLNVAVVDCETNVLTGNSTPPLSIMRIARFFLTEPASGTGDIYAEFIEQAAPGDGGIQHLVQLVR